jgi:hypothetical protein
MAGHLGLCVVYLVDESWDVLFYKHLEQIQRCAGGQPFRIYAGVNRLAAKYLDHLRGLDFVELCELAPTEQRNSAEHAHYLDQLTAIAIADGAHRIATFDVDSFPIDPDWQARCEAQFAKGMQLVGVLRRENGDTASPHPSFMLFTREFQTRYQPTFSLMQGDPRALAFQKATGQPRLDTAAGYGVVLHEQDLPWSALVRSNAVNDHPLLAGIYGRMAFHFGGGSRDKVFSVDVREARKTRPAATLEELWPEIAARNEVVARRMLGRIEADLDGYMHHLLGD